MDDLNGYVMTRLYISACAYYTGCLCTSNVPHQRNDTYLYLFGNVFDMEHQSETCLDHSQCSLVMYGHLGIVQAHILATLAA